MDLIETNRSFAFETTASGMNYLRNLKAARRNGYEIHIIFLWLASPEQAIKRVDQRIKQGGHSIPKQIIIKRYYSGLKNLFAHYLPLVDSANIMDNSSEESSKKVNC